tara:strand:+ start:324 stop:803 length:480 start_codon:yes stop_codon:yes gene_type:complete
MEVKHEAHPPGGIFIHRCNLLDLKPTVVFKNQVVHRRHGQHFRSTPFMPKPRQSASLNWGRLADLGDNSEITTNVMLNKPLIRRVSIYLALSTTAVIVMNMLEVEQKNPYTIYLPLFIGIYVLSRWIDGRFAPSTTSGINDSGESDDPSEQRSKGGFGS